LEFEIPSSLLKIVRSLLDLHACSKILLHLRFELLPFLNGHLVHASETSVLRLVHIVLAICVAVVAAHVLVVAHVVCVADVQILRHDLLEFFELCLVIIGVIVCVGTLPVVMLAVAFHWRSVAWHRWIALWRLGSG